jgi:hypothetical protein
MRGKIYSEGRYPVPLLGFGRKRSIDFYNPKPTASSLSNAKPAWGVIISLVISLDLPQKFASKS